MFTKNIIDFLKTSNICFKMVKYETGKWNLNGLVTNPKSPAFSRQIQNVEKKSRQFEKIKTKLNPKISSKKFRKTLQ